MIKLNYLVIGDIHLGHMNNPTSGIVHSLDMFFDCYKPESMFTDLDIIFIAGDLFDRLLDYGSKEIDIINGWFRRLLGFCHRNQIKLRILEGTPSHDWKQTARLQHTWEQEYKDKVDFAYYDTLAIEYIEKHDVHVLYVPDEWSSSADNTYKQVQELLASNGLDQVDIAVMHGAFNYQLRHTQSPNHHDESNYLDIVKYVISIGHVHSFSINSRIIPQGSFDRVRHGEEEPKGGVRVWIEGNDYRYQFIENRLAHPFITIKIKGTQLEPAIKQIAKRMATIPVNAYVSVKAIASHPVFITFDELQRKYPLHTLTKSVDKEDLPKISAPLIELDYTPITITPDNVVGMVLEEMSVNDLITDEDITYLKDTLTKLLED